MQEEEDQEGEQLDVDVVDEIITNGYTEEEAADAVQEELVANAGFKGRGKGKSKGEGFFTPWHTGKTCGPPDHRPSLEDRKRRFQEIKKRSTCKVCRGIGHWGGDPECKDKPKTAMLAFSGERQLHIREDGDKYHFAPASDLLSSHHPVILPLPLMIT